MAFRKTTIHPQLLGQGMSAGEVDPKLTDKPSFVKNGVFRRAGAVDKRNGTEIVRGSVTGSGLFTLDGVMHSFGPGLEIQGESVEQFKDSFASIMDIDYEVIAGGRSSSIRWVDAAQTGDILAVSYVEIDEPSAASLTYTTTIKTFSIARKSLTDFTEVQSASATPLFVKVVDVDGTINAAWTISGSRPKYKEIAGGGVIGGTLTVAGGAPNANSNVFAAASIDNGVAVGLCFAYESAANEFVFAQLADFDATSAAAYTSLASFGMCQWGADEACVAFQDVDGANLTTSYVSQVNLTGGTTTIETPVSAAVFSSRTGGEDPGGIGVADDGSGVEVTVWTSSSVTSGLGFPYDRTLITRTYNKDGTLGTSLTISRSCEIASTPFAISGRLYCFVVMGTDNTAAGAQDQVLCIMNAGGEVYGTTLSQQAISQTSAWTSAAGALPTAALVSGKWMLGAVREEGSGKEASAVVVSAEFDAQVSTCHERDGVALIPSAMPRYFNSNFLYQIGPLYAPTIEVANSGTPGNLTSGITYSYSACFSITDDSGRTWFGPMSDAATVVSNGDSVDYESSSHHPTGFSGIKLNIYRSKEDIEGASFLVESQDNDDLTGAFELTGTDDISDDDIDANERLYSDTALVHAPWPGHRVSGFSADRYWIVPRNEENKKVWYSNSLSPSAAINFTGKSVELPEHGGAITGIVSYLDKTIILKETAVYAIEGSGPDEKGMGEFVGPYLVDGSTGCSNSRSIAKFGLSVCFESLQGIRALTPSGKLEPIGADVRYYTDSSNVCAAITLPATSEVVFLTDGGAADDGEALVYNYRFGIWSIWTNHNAHSAAFDGTHIWFLDTDSGSLRKQTDAYQDPSTSWITLEAVGGWVARANVGGYTRTLTAQVLGQKITDCTLNVKFGYDYDDTFPDTHSDDLSDIENIDWHDHLDGADAGATHKEQAMLIKAWPKRTRASAHRVKIYDEMPQGGSPTQGCSFTSISWEFQGKPGSNRGNNRNTDYGG